MSELKTVTRQALFDALYKNLDILPDWHEVSHMGEGYVTINFYIDAEEEDDE